MFTITLSSGTVFGLGVVAGLFVGVIGLCVVAVLTSKKKNK